MRVVYDRRAIMQHAWWRFRFEQKAIERHLHFGGHYERTPTMAECIKDAWAVARHDARMWRHGHRPSFDLFFVVY